MRRPPSNPWFVRRQIGIGWRPWSWQGWVVTVTMVGLAVVAVATLHRSAAGYGIAVAVIAVYFGIIRLTAGPRPETEAPDDAADGGDARDGGTAAEGEPRAPATRLPAEQKAALLAAGREPRPDPGEAALVVDHLTKAYDERVAVSDVSFSVAYGEVFGFLGPNGAGKTTTVRTLGTLIVPTSGSAVVAGIPLAPDNGVAIRQRIAIMPESPGLYLRLTVTQNLEFFAGLYKLADPAARIASVLAAVNMSARAHDPCGALSKGLRQRVGLARALLSDPTVIFLDEPTSGLDPVASREVHELIDGLRRRGVTIFLTTHRLDEAERLCDRVAIMNTTLRTIGRPDELRDQLFQRSLRVTTAAPLAAPGSVFARLRGVEGWQADGDGAYVVSVSDPRIAAPAVTRALVSAGADVLSIGESHHSLEDVYLELISDDVEADAPR